MTVFQSKKITTPQRFCLCLKQARLARGISLLALAQKTKLPVNYLSAIEECRPQDIPAAPVYIKQYIRRYAHALGLNNSTTNTVIDSFAIEQTWHTISNHTPGTSHPVRGIKRSAFLNVPQLMRGLAMVGIIGLGAFLVGGQMVRFLKPPTLTIMNPQNGLVTTMPSILIEGYTEKEVAVQVNGVPIQNNEEGFFQAPLPLETGVNTIAVQATKKSGKQRTEIRTVVRETEPSPRISLRTDARQP